VAEGIQRELTGDWKTKCVAVELVDDFDADSVGVGIPEESHFEAVWLRYASSLRSAST
jgi:hypothetical protein